MIRKCWLRLMAGKWLRMSEKKERQKNKTLSIFEDSVLLMSLGQLGGDHFPPGSMRVNAAGCLDQCEQGIAGHLVGYDKVVNNGPVNCQDIAWHISAHRSGIRLKNRFSKLARSSSPPPLGNDGALPGKPSPLVGSLHFLAHFPLAARPQEAPGGFSVKKAAEFPQLYLDFELPGGPALAWRDIFPILDYVTDGQRRAGVKDQMESEKTFRQGH